MTTLDHQIPNPETVPYRNIAIRTGAILGLISIVINLIYYLTGLNTIMLKTPALSWGLSLINIGIMLYFYINALKAHRHDDLGGYLSMGRCLGFGTLAGVISGIIGGVWMYIFTAFIDPSFIDTIKELQMAELEKQGLSEEQIEQNMKYASMFMGPGAMAIYSILGGAFFGFIGGLISGFILKKDRPMI